MPCDFLPHPLIKFLDFMIKLIQTKSTCIWANLLDTQKRIVSAAGQLRSQWADIYEFWFIQKITVRNENILCFLFLSCISFSRSVHSLAPVETQYCVPWKFLFHKVFDLWCHTVRQGFSFVSCQCVTSPVVFIPCVDLHVPTWIYSLAFISLSVFLYLSVGEDLCWSKDCVESIFLNDWRGKQRL